MRHRARSRKLSRTSAHRSALYRNMVTSLLLHERIETTDAKAKELRRVADRMITLGKRGTVHARRRAARVIRGRDVAGKVFGELAERYRERPGGYTRVLKLRHRVGDAAPLSIVELVEETAQAKKSASKKAGGKKATARKAAPRKGDDETPASEKAAPRTRKKAATSKAAKSKVAKKKTAKKKSRASRPSE